MFLLGSSERASSRIISTANFLGEVVRQEDFSRTSRSSDSHAFFTWQFWSVTDSRLSLKLANLFLLAVLKTNNSHLYIAIWQFSFKIVGFLPRHHFGTNRRCCLSLRCFSSAVSAARWALSYSLLRWSFSSFFWKELEVLGESIMISIGSRPM